MALFCSVFVFLLNEPSSAMFEIYGGDFKGASMNWGVNLFMGVSVSRSFFLRNAGTVPITVSFKTTNWKPLEIDSYMTVKWDYCGAPIYPGQEIKITMTLQSVVSIDFAKFLMANNITDYAFSIEIYSSKL